MRRAWLPCHDAVLTARNAQVNTITLRLHDCEHQTDASIVGWYMLIQDDLTGSEVVRASLKRYIKKNMQH